MYIDLEIDRKSSTISVLGEFIFIILYTISISETHTAFAGHKIAAGNLMCLEERGYYKE